MADVDTIDTDMLIAMFSDIAIELSKRDKDMTNEQLHEYCMSLTAYVHIDKYSEDEMSAHCEC